MYKQNKSYIFAEDMKKYNKLDKQQVLNLFQEKPVVKRADITKKYGCSVYSVRQIVDEMMDDKSIRLTNYGYKLWN